MGDFRELRFVLALLVIGLFTLSARHALSIPSITSGGAAYQSAIVACLAFIWGLMVWLAYEDPMRFREVVIISMVGLGLLAGAEIGIILSGQASQAQAVSPLGPATPFADALWAEVGVLAAFGVLLWYFRPAAPSIDKWIKENQEKPR